MISEFTIPSIWNIFFGAYESLLGHFFYAFLLFLTLGAIYIRTRNFGMVFFLGLIISLFLMPILPGGGVRTVIWFLVVSGITYIFFKLLVGHK